MLPSLLRVEKSDFVLSGGRRPRERFNSRKGNFPVFGEPISPLILGIDWLTSGNAGEALKGM